MFNLDHTPLCEISGPDVFGIQVFAYFRKEIEGFPAGSGVKNPPATHESQVRSLGQENPLEKEMATTPVFLPGKFHGRRSLAGYSPRGHKSQTRLSD